MARKAKEAAPGARYYVATYGNMGLDVQFYRDPLEYGRAIKAAERDHDAGQLDSYTYGTCTV